MSRRSERRGKTASRTVGKRYLYRVYGLIVESELELPELVAAQSGKPDVQIRFGEVPETLENLIVSWSWCKASKSECIFDIEGVAQYHVAGGRKITIERRLDLSESISAADIRSWLLGSAFAGLLYQRGCLPLHVSAVKAPSGVWAFTGESGEGKSTLAAFLHRRYGWELVSDDVSVIDPAKGNPVIYPGPRKLKLWADALECLDFDTCKIVRELTNTDKFQLYLSEEGEYQPEPLRGIIVLDSAVDTQSSIIEPLIGAEAFDGCMSAVYRPYMWELFKLPKERFAETVQLCQSIQVYRFRRPRSLDDFEANLPPLMELLQKN